MAFDIGVWMGGYLSAVKDRFGSRLVFVGLQGSYGRNEATDDSDIDVVLILDQVTVPDLVAYDQAIARLPHREKVCGFVSGTQELSGWARSDLFQFCHDTTPLLGSIDHLLPTITTEDVRQAILMGAGNIYHLCGHNVVHEKDARILRSLYKSAVFVVQAVHYERTGVYTKSRMDLLSAVSPQEQQILQASAALREPSDAREGDFLRLSELLFVWAGQLLRQYGRQP